MLTTHKFQINKLLPILVPSLLFTMIFYGCSQVVGSIQEIQIGYTRQAVITIAGDPDEINDFVLPSTPFFGPQEGLVELIPAGTTVEEWRYISEKDVTYVWFAGEGGIPRADWTVIDFATYPLDAIF
jgi:hypothetical protein